MHQLKRWLLLRDTPKQKRGTKVRQAFEQDVWGRLVLATWQYQNDVKVAVVVNSIVYSYEIVKQCAKEARASGPFEDDAKVQSLKFSDKWVFGFLRREKMRRRKITHEQKEIPSEPEVRRQMSIGQATILSLGLVAAVIWNMDETAFTWAIGPQYSYVGTGARRAEGEQADTKLRITAAITGGGTGLFMPLFMILKHSKSSAQAPDQTKMKVIQQLYDRDKGFGISDGWSIHTWERELTLTDPSSKNNVTATHRVIYIIHNATGHVITSQHKAWNDTVRMAMIIDLVWNPRKLKDIQMLIWMDNCGSHKTAAIEKLLEELGIQIAFYPPNMTGYLQMLDLVVNGPIKQHTRFRRAMAICAAFKDYIAAYYKEHDRTDEEGRKEMRFRPPKPNMEEAIKDMISLFGPTGKFQTEDFKASMTRTMVKTGCICKSDTDPTLRTFEVYNEASMVRGSKAAAMTCIPTGTREPIVAVRGQREIAAEEAKAQQRHNDMVLMMEAYLDGDSDEEDSSDDEEEGSSDEESDKDT